MRYLTSALLAASLATPALAKSITFAVTADPRILYTQAVNLAPFRSFLNKGYQGFLRCDGQIRIEPALATRREPIRKEQGWRFNLRERVTFQDAPAFTADDVNFPASIAKPLFTGGCAAGSEADFKCLNNRCLNDEAVWGTRINIELTPRPDSFFRLRRVTTN